MLPRRFRLPRELFEEVAKKGKRLDGTLFTLSYIPGGGSSLGGAVVSKKVCAKAVMRNTLKRRLRAVLLEFLRVAPSGRYVLFAKKGAHQATFGDLTDALKEITSKV